MFDVATGQGKCENAIYTIPQGKSSLFEKKNQIFSRQIEWEVAITENHLSIRRLRFFLRKLTNHEKANPIKTLHAEKRK